MLTERIIRDAALRLFTKHGSAATTVEQIAELAGISERTFFRYFPTKESAAIPSRDYFWSIFLSHSHDVKTVQDAQQALIGALTDMHNKQAEEERDLFLLSLDLITNDPGIGIELCARDIAMEKDIFTEFSLRIPESEHFALRIMASTVIAAHRTARMYWSSQDNRDIESLAQIHAQAMSLLSEIYG